MVYTEEQKQFIFNLLSEKLNKVFDNEDLIEDNLCTPFWKNLMVLLDYIEDGDFFGSFQLKFAGTKCFDIKLVDQTFKPASMFAEVDKIIESL